MIEKRLSFWQNISLVMLQPEPQNIKMARPIIAILLVASALSSAFGTNRIAACGESLDVESQPGPNSQWGSPFHFLTAIGYQAFPHVPFQRKMELQNKKESIGLDLYEEGELRGLYVYSENPEGAVLLQREFLASQNIVKMVSHQRERLREIRASEYKVKNKDGSLLRPIGRAGLVMASDFYDPRAEILALELKIRHLKAKLEKINQNGMMSPLEIIRSELSQIPDEFISCKLEDLPRQLGSNEGRLERYFLSLIDLPTPSLESKMAAGFPALDSMRCLEDRIRTRKFILGLHETIAELETRGRSEIRVLDAGTGAIPILSLYAALISDRVKVTALEINPQSAQIATRIIRSLGLQNQVEVIYADATNFISKDKYDLIISETMHSGLTSEPMVQIFSHLKDFLRPDGVMLPDEVTVLSTLVDLNHWLAVKNFVVINGTIYKLLQSHWKSVVRYKPGDALEEIQLDHETSHLESGTYLLFVMSEVKIGNQRLKPFESLITMPVPVRNWASEPDIILLNSSTVRTPVRVRYAPGQPLINVRL